MRKQIILAAVLLCATSACEATLSIAFNDDLSGGSFTMEIGETAEISIYSDNEGIYWTWLGMSDASLGEWVGCMQATPLSCVEMVASIPECYCCDFAGVEYFDDMWWSFQPPFYPTTCVIQPGKHLFVDYTAIDEGVNTLMILDTSGVYIIDEIQIVVPEPATLMLLGLGVLGIIRRRV